jgi:hypothetical protein
VSDAQVCIFLWNGLSEHGHSKQLQHMISPRVGDVQDSGQAGLQRCSPMGVQGCLHVVTLASHLQLPGK